MPTGQAGELSALFAPVVPVADAVLYEGYLLYPYRRSSAKNKVRWQFGVLLPRGWAEEHGLADTGVAGSAESWWQQTECLVSAPAAHVVHVRVRFLQLQQRTVEQRAADGSWRPVQRAVTAGREVFGFEEAVPREADITAPLHDLLTGEPVTEIGAPAGRDVDTVADPGTETVRIVRRREAVSARVGLSAVACGRTAGLLRLRVRVENAVDDVHPGSARATALGRALIATHTLIAVPGGAFVSLLEPPDWARGPARGCRNVHTYPVLAGAGRGASVVLSSPIILYDHPGVAPESPGDLHDSAEIDEILSLRALTLTDREKAEARATDSRAAAVIDRVEEMPPDAFGRLHGVIRSQGEPAPGETGSVVVAGVRLRSGSRVRLRPRAGGTDAHDMFLAGRTARVESVLFDMDGTCHLAVTVEDDPAAELNVWYGRFRYFGTDEIEPLEGAAGAGQGGGPGRRDHADKEG
jgi:hypothetical protein